MRRESRKGVRWGWLVLGVGLWLAGLAWTPLTESTEGRYVSVGAEMVRSGNWLEPNFDGLPHFTKPPWAYWAIAASLKLLPDREWAARLPATVAAWIALLLALAIGRSRGASPVESSRLTFLLLASPLFVGQARLPSGDVHLAAGILAVIWSVMDSDRKMALRVSVGAVGFAVGILAKGHIIFLWTLLPAVLWWLRHPLRHRRAAAVLGLSLACGIVLAWPWFAWARHAHPGILDYWMGAETHDRVLTNHHARSEAWWYYLVVLPLMVLPWIPEALRALRQELRRRTTTSLLWLCILLPALVLQWSVSKRPNYLLPLVIFLAILAARVEPARWLRQRCGLALGLMLLLPLGLSRVESIWPVTRQLAEAIPPGAEQVIVNHTLPESLPFYLGRSVATRNLHRELRFATPQQRHQWWADDWDLAQRLHPGDVILSPRRKHDQIAEDLGSVPWRVREVWDEWELLEVTGQALPESDGS